MAAEARGDGVAVGSAAVAVGNSTVTVGSAVDALETPVLVVDADALERNIARLADWTRARGLRLRPHAKTHKSAAIARLQRAAGAVGVCVQKLSEAQALADAGIDDIYISNEIVDPAKLQRVAALAGRVRLALAVDSALGAERLAQALQSAGTMLDVFVEIDVGHGRCGVAAEEGAALARRVASLGLRLAGLQAYQGRAQHLRSESERRAAIAEAVSRVRRVQGEMAAAGLPCPLVTGAGTGTFPLEAESGVYGELQAGSYVFMDVDYASNESGAAGPRFEHALFLKSQVISRRPGQAVVDAGHKSHAIESGLPRVWLADARADAAGTATADGHPSGRFAAIDFVNGGDEHGLLRAAATPPQGRGSGYPPGVHGAASAGDAALAGMSGVTGKRAAAEASGARSDLGPADADDGLPALGETVWLVPGHCDPTVNLHDALIVVRGGLQRGIVEAIWPVDARGCLR